MEKYITPEAQGVMRSAAYLAQRHGQKLYLAGGAVRDLLLERYAADIDLVIEGNALDMAKELAAEINCDVVTHTEFLTAKLLLPSFSLDLASARDEYYPHPGALPVVRPAGISADLKRRDFSINAMAISLNKTSFGQLLDENNGLYDARNKLIRVLHEHSFRDDATRMWRAARYEQRLDFRIESATMALIQQDLPGLKNISGERLRYEIECIFGEALPEKPLARAAELGLLSYLCPQLTDVKCLSAWCEHARQFSMPQKSPIGLYLALLLYNLDIAECEKVAQLLKLNKNLRRILHDSARVKASLATLASKEIPLSTVYHALRDCSTIAIEANLIAAMSDNARRHIRLYLERLRYVKPFLNGNDLLSMGIKPGPNINTILERLLDARLDGETSSCEDEIELLERLG